MALKRIEYFLSYNVTHNNGLRSFVSPYISEAVYTLVELNEQKTNCEAMADVTDIKKRKREIFEYEIED